MLSWETPLAIAGREHYDDAVDDGGGDRGSQRLCHGAERSILKAETPTVRDDVRIQCNGGVECGSRVDQHVVEIACQHCLDRKQLDIRCDCEYVCRLTRAVAHLIAER